MVSKEKNKFDYLKKIKKRMPNVHESTFVNPKDYPQDFQRLVYRVNTLVENKFNYANLAVVDWCDVMPSINLDSYEFEYKPLLRIHIIKDGELILSIFYDIYELASICMDGPYFEIYPVDENDIARYYPSNFNYMMDKIDSYIRENLLAHEEYKQKQKVIQLKEYFDRRSLDKRIRG